jgi:transcriptional regulator with XRE-family HTH domain
VSSYSRVPSAIEKIFYGRLVARLQARRVAIGMTQEELDQELGVSEGQVAKWESFARLPGAFMLVCWSNRLGVILSTEIHNLEDPSQGARPL